MKKYIQPKIKAISLIPEQAILEVCKLSGLYFELGVKCVYGTGGIWTCSVSGRGAIVSSHGTSQADDAIPS
ncbi:MAG: hypothetical protein PHQ52_01460 [Candidatus Omnitrophica bacterium]|nr:hypothetical protein [Candidatus Omnitrophota bacterium]